MDNLNQLRNYIVNRNLVLFIGAGVSIPSGGKSWNELLSEICQELNYKELVNYPPDRIANILDKKGDLSILKAKIYEKLNKLNKPSEVHNIIAENSGKFRHIITTNYDILLEQAFRNKTINYKLIYKYEQTKYFSENDINLFKIAGHIEDIDSIIITEREIYKNMNSELMSFVVERILCSNSILFLGSSIRDVSIKGLLEKVSEKNYLSNKRFRIVCYEGVNDREKEEDLCLGQEWDITTIEIDSWSDLPNIMRKLFSNEGTDVPYGRSNNTSDGFLWRSISKNGFTDLIHEILQLEKRRLESQSLDINDVITFLGESKSFNIKHIVNIIMQGCKNISNDKILFATNVNLDENELIYIYKEINSLGVDLLIWEYNDIAYFLDKYDFLVSRYSLLDKNKSSVKIENNMSNGQVNYLTSKNFVNRKNEKIFINKFLKSEVKTILLITGLSGMGKSVLSMHSYEINQKDFLNIHSYKFKKDFSQTDFIIYLNEFFIENNIYDFNVVCVNCNYSDAYRIKKIIEILNKYRFYIVFDNFEDIVKDYKIENTFIRELLEGILDFGISSKIIITSRIEPDEYIFTTSNKIEKLYLASISESDIINCYLDTLPNLKKAISGRRNISNNLLVLTGGIPLFLNLLNNNLQIQSFDIAYISTLEKYKETIFEKILNLFNDKMMDVILMVSVLEEAVNYDFFEFFQISTNDVFKMTSSGVLNYNIKYNTYLIHSLIGDIIKKNFSSEYLKKLRKKIILYLNHKFNKISNDEKEIHLIKRKILKQYIFIEDYEKAAELLGRIATRYISLNSIDEVTQIWIQLNKYVKSIDSVIWLLNVEAHMLDYKKIFSKTEFLYKKMYDLANKTTNIELLVLSTSNYATTYRRNADFSNAIALYLKALKLAQKYKLKKLTGSILNNIGQTYSYMKEYSKAYYTFEKCIENRNNMNDDFRVAATMSHMGDLCMKIYELSDLNFYEMSAYFLTTQKDKSYWLEKAYINLQNSLNKQEAIGNYWLLDRTYELLSKYWYLKGNSKKSSLYQDMSININKEKGTGNNIPYY